MRRFIVQQWVTVDNIAAEEDGGLSFVTAQAQDDAELNASLHEFIGTVDAMMLGANTYAMSKDYDYWPTIEGQGAYGEKLHRLTKYVASKNLDEAPWGNSAAATVTHDPVDTIQELKQQDGKDIWLWGSLTLMRSLFDANIVDEVRLLVCPSTRGKGTYMFNDRRDMKLIEAKPFKNGVVLLRYANK